MTGPHDWIYTTSRDMTHQRFVTEPSYIYRPEETSLRMKLLGDQKQEPTLPT